MKRRLRAYISLLLSAVMMTAVFSVNAAAGGVVEVGHDIAGHWAESAIRHNLLQGTVNVYGDGTIRPDMPLSRAEFAFSMDMWMNRNSDLLAALGLNLRPPLATAFFDVPVNHPFFPNIRSIYSKWLMESDVTYFRPDEPITRQQVSESWVALFRMLDNSTLNDAYFFNLPVDTILARYWDSYNIRDDSRLVNSRMAVATMIDQNFIAGYADETFRPYTPMLRGEFYYTLARIDQAVRHFLLHTPATPPGQEAERPRILAIETRNHTVDGFDLVITVNRAASRANAEVILAPYTGYRLLPQNEVFERNLYRNTTPLRLSHMNRLVEQADQSVYSVRLSHTYLRNYSLFAMLHVQGLPSNIERAFVTYIGSAPGNILEPLPPVLAPSDIRLFNVSAIPVLGHDRSFELQITVNDAAFLGNADVIVAFTTDRSFRPSRENINLTGANVTSMTTWINAMRHISSFGGSHILSTNISVPTAGRYFVHVAIRMGGMYSVIHSDEIVLGDAVGDIDADILSIRYRKVHQDPDDPDSPVIAVYIYFVVNAAAQARNSELIFAWSRSAIPNVNADNLLTPDHANLHGRVHTRINDGALQFVRTVGDQYEYRIRLSGVSLPHTGFYDLNVFAYAALRTGMRTTAVRHTRFTIESPHELDPTVTYPVIFAVRPGYTDRGTLMAHARLVEEISSGDELYVGTSVRFTAGLGPDYAATHRIYWFVDGDLLEGVHTPTLTRSVPTGGIEIGVEFREIEIIPPVPLIVTFNAIGNGSISAETTATPPQTVVSPSEWPATTSVRFTATPEPGYEVIGWSATGGFIPPGFTGDSIIVPVTVLPGLNVTVTFGPAQPRVTWDVDPGGSGSVSAMSPDITAANQNVPRGSAQPVGRNIVFTAFPASGVNFVHWYVDGTTFAGNPSPPIPVPISGLHAVAVFDGTPVVPVNVSVNFNALQMSATRDVGGVTQPVNPGTMVPAGSVITFTPIGDWEGHRFEWTMGSDTGNNPAAAFNITATDNLTVVRAPITAEPTYHVVTFNEDYIAATVGGSAIASGDDVEQGATVVFTRVGDWAGYRFRWTMGGESEYYLGATLSRTVTAPLNVVREEIPPTPTHAVTFDYGYMSATAAGDPIDSGDDVDQGTSVVFTQLDPLAWAGHWFRWEMGGVHGYEDEATLTVPSVTAPLTVTRVPIPQHAVTILEPDYIYAEVGGVTMVSPVNHGTEVVFSRVYLSNWDGFRFRWDMGGVHGYEEGPTLPLTVTAPLTVTRVPIPTADEYAVTFGSGIEATVGGDPINSGDEFEEGTVVTFTLDSPLAYGERARWTVNGVEGDWDTYPSINRTVEGPLDVTVERADPQQLTINNGDITPVGQTADGAHPVGSTVTVNLGYSDTHYIYSVTGPGVTWTPGSPTASLTMPNEPVNIVVTWALAVGMNPEPAVDLEFNTILYPDSFADHFPSGFIQLVVAPLPGFDLSPLQVEWELDGIGGFWSTVFELQDQAGAPMSDNDQLIARLAIEPEPEFLYLHPLEAAAVTVTATVHFGSYSRIFDFTLVFQGES